MNLKTLTFALLLNIFALSSSAFSQWGSTNLGNVDMENKQYTDTQLISSLSNIWTYEKLESKVLEYSKNDSVDVQVLKSFPNGKKMYKLEVGKKGAKYVLISIAAQHADESSGNQFWPVVIDSVLKTNILSKVRYLVITPANPYGMTGEHHDETPTNCGGSKDYMIHSRNVRFESTDYKHDYTNQNAIKGINLNRVWKTGYEQPETLAIKKVIELFDPDKLFVLDHHETYCNRNFYFYEDSLVVGLGNIIREKFVSRVIKSYNNYSEKFPFSLQNNGVIEDGEKSFLLYDDFTKDPETTLTEYLTGIGVYSLVPEVPGQGWVGLHMEERVAMHAFSDLSGLHILYELAEASTKNSTQ